MDYFVDLSRISELAYPNPEQRGIRDANLRQEFIKNINHPMIAARLRENPNMLMEELLDFAILLESCYEASKVSTNHVNFLDTNTNDTLNAKITNLTNLMEKMVVNQIDQDLTNDAPYQYQGDLTGHFKMALHLLNKEAYLLLLIKSLRNRDTTHRAMASSNLSTTDTVKTDLKKDTTQSKTDPIASTLHIEIPEVTLLGIEATT